MRRAAVLLLAACTPADVPSDAGRGGPASLPPLWSAPEARGDPVLDVARALREAVAEPTGPGPLWTVPPPPDEAQDREDAPAATNAPFPWFDGNARSPRWRQEVRRIPEWVSAVLRDLRATARPDGGWAACGTSQESDLATTALAVLVILRTGATPTTVGDGPALREGVRFLLRRLRADGSFADGGDASARRDELVATWALLAAWGRTGLRILEEPSQRALQRCVGGTPQYAWIVTTEVEAEMVSWQTLVRREASAAGSCWVLWLDPQPDAALGDTGRALVLACQVLLDRRDLCGSWPGRHGEAMARAVGLVGSESSELRFQEPMRQVLVEAARTREGPEGAEWVERLRRPIPREGGLAAPATATGPLATSALRARLLDLLCLLSDEPFTERWWCSWGAADD